MLVPPRTKRVAIECLVIASMIKETGSILRWVSSERQLADGLTKVTARQDFVEQLKGGYIQLVFDPEVKAAKKKSAEERRKINVGNNIQHCNGYRNFSGDRAARMPNLRVKERTIGGCPY